MEKVYLHVRTGFHVVFEPEDEGWFVVHVPDLPGCISQGSSFSDAVLNIDSAICDYLEAIGYDPEDVDVTESGLDGGESSSTENVTWVATAA